MKYLLSTLLLVLTFASNAQEVVKATSQGWAGGVCCVSGTNYAVTFKSSSGPDAYKIEEIWLSNQARPLSGTLAQATKGEVIVNFGITRDETYNHEILPPDDIKVDEEATRHDALLQKPDFKGVALIVLKKNGKKMKVIVEKFEELPFLAYP